MINDLDEETLRLFKRIAGFDFFNRDFIEGEDNWNDEEIFNGEYKEFDSYRIYDTFARMGKELDKDTTFDVLETSHLFTINDKIKFTLLNHKPIKITKEDALNLPFDNIFLDVILDSGDTKLFGLHIHFPMNRELTKRAFGRDDLFYIQTISFTKGKGFKKGGKILFSLEKGIIRHDKIVDNVDKKFQKVAEEILKEEKYNKTDYDIETMIETFITNLILFFNEPRVTIYINEHNNERRIRKGKIPIPSQIVTKMSFDLENYIEKIYYTGQSNSHLDYAFWVRGHKRRLMSPRYKEQKIIWVSAFLKGDGLQPPQIHKIE